MNDKELKEILGKHLKWLNNEDGGERAALDGASLNEASLIGASLDGASLIGASLNRASLNRASLIGASLDEASLNEASLNGASLDRASLDEASLDGASLIGASLIGASLIEASLIGASLIGASLIGASLNGASLDRETIQNINRYRPFQIVPQEGEIIAWKKGENGCLIKLLIPKNAKRTSSLVGRKCRASKVKVLAIWDKNGKEIKECGGWHDSGFIYKVGRIAKPDSYDPDIRVECSHGIHFFVTKEEAEDF